MLKKSDIKIWFACNNHCSFCVQWDKRYKFPQKKLSHIKEILEKERKSWSRCVVFTWWEPTVHPDLVEAVAHAKKLWFQFIQIQSNGTNFDDIEYVKKLIEAWVTEFNPSIHGFYSETHDKQVWTKWAWERVVRWLIILRKLNQVIITNTVITQDNYKELPKLAQLLVKLWVNQFQFAFVHILWSAQKNKYTVVPKKSDIMPYVHKWLDIAKKAKVRAFTEAIPYCFMQWYEWAIAENVLNDASIFDAEWVIDSYKNYRLYDWKIKDDKCRYCKHYYTCEWPWKEYPEMYTWEEFIPIK